MNTGFPLPAGIKTRFAGVKVCPVRSVRFMTKVSILTFYNIFFFLIALLSRILSGRPGTSRKETVFLHFPCQSAPAFNFQKPNCPNLRNPWR